MAATTILSGVHGTVTLAGSTSIASFTINAGADLIDVSSFGNTFRVRVSGLKDSSGTATAFADTTTPFVAGTTGSGVFTFATGKTYTVPFIIGNVNIVGEVGGVYVVTFTWANNDTTGPVTAWA